MRCHYRLPREGIVYRQGRNGYPSLVSSLCSSPETMTSLPAFHYFKVTHGTRGSIGLCRSPPDGMNHLSTRTAVVLCLCGSDLLHRPHQCREGPSPAAGRPGTPPSPMALSHPLVQFPRNTLDAQRAEDLAGYHCRLPVPVSSPTPKSRLPAVLKARTLYRLFRYSYGIRSMRCPRSLLM